ncbi:hypothetical protein [Bacillus sp. NEB1478]|uniref:hypothetical protein n=1 Tax=Bacillus sp. NEB1478 TaxID=3073816 RepID=UPI0028734277|nr:hypothetical protein [Bacillus sp. NEB1478]WNB92616.1 hypothetical protein RGB74_02810 [Bacillus sp. NEB1478]
MSQSDVISLMFLWGIAAFIFLKKLTKEDKSEFWKSIKKPSVYFEDVFRHLGTLLLFTGIIADFPVLKKIGIFVILASIFALGVNTWELNKRKSTIAMFIPLIFAMFYIFFSFKDYLF